MKKVLFSILAVGAIVACTKTGVEFDDASEISFAPVAATTTKAVTGAIDVVTYPTNENFLVWGYWQDVPAGNDKAAFTAPKTYIGGKKFVYQNGSNGVLWEGETAYYWPKTGSMIFACVSPADAPFYAGSTPQHDLTNEFKFTYENPSNTANTVDLLWANCAGSYNEATAGDGGVPVEFKHALAWITFKVQGLGVSQGKYKINSLTLNSVNTLADFTSAGNGSWSEAINPADYLIFTGAQSLTGSAADLETNKKGTIVIPQTKDTGYTATLVYTNELGDEAIVETINLELGTGWEIGKHYTYTITFSPTEILIAPKVATWTPVDQTIAY